MTSKPLSIPSSYGDRERYCINSGKQLRFEEIPSKNYKLSQTAESIQAKGSLYQLFPSASDDANAVTWDVYTHLPLFAARYDNPLVSGYDSKTIYWEFEILQLGYENGKGGVAFGWLVKDSGSEEVTKNPNGSARAYVEGDLPISLSGPSLLWQSADGGLYDQGRKVDGIDPYIAKSGDVVGLGITFEFTDTVPMVPSRDVNSSTSVKPSAASRYLDRKGNKTARVADVQNLAACPTTVFLTINGERRDVSVEVARSYIDGRTDIFPVLLVHGTGVEGKVRMGEAVKFEGHGGVYDAKSAAAGNAKNADFKQSKFSKMFKVPNSGGWFAMGAGGGAWNSG